jgi:hypothetical protein
MSFELTNVPAVFMNTMNRFFYDYLDQFVVVFIDDILVYSKGQEDHGVHLQKALKRLRQEQHFAKLEKCEFWLDSMSFLGHVISGEGVLVGSEKVKAIVD